MQRDEANTIQLEIEQARTDGLINGEPFIRPRALDIPADYARVSGNCVFEPGEGLIVAVLKEWGQQQLKNVFRKAV